MELDTLGDRKTALFIIISDTDDTFNFLVSMAYTQLFNLLCEKADDVYGGRLPVHVRCLIDEAANIQGGLQAFVIATYPAEDVDILAAERYYKGLENELQQTIDRYPADHPQYNEF